MIPVCLQAVVLDAAGNVEVGPHGLDGFINDDENKTENSKPQSHNLCYSYYTSGSLNRNMYDLKPLSTHC